MNNCGRAAAVLTKQAEEGAVGIARLMTRCLLQPVFVVSAAGSHVAHHSLS